MRSTIVWRSGCAAIAAGTALALTACSDAPAPAPRAAADGVSPSAGASGAEGTGTRAKAASQAAPRPRPASVRRVVEEGANRPPAVRSLTVAASEDDPSLFEARIEADDPDGDHIDLDVVWFVNGAPASRGELTFDPSHQKRGDSVHVEVTPHDGKIAGATAESGHIGIQNAAPLITSQPPSTMPGGVYRYMVEAKDPEGDAPIRFELLQRPDGMRLDPYNGELTWRPSADQAGEHTVEIAVQDPSGARSTQEFVLPITAPAAPPASPAD